ncbi:MAG: acyl-CoA thioesterase [Pirellulales bacterium]|nr:acyl-CoA thioesterase [Pirellulales bacterium]
MLLHTHEIEFRVRYKETDAMGVVHHANYLTYFEMGRVELLRANGGDYRKMEEEGLFLVVARMNCSFHRPARYDDVVRLRTTTTRVTGAKIEHEYQLFRGNELLCKANSVLACIDRSGEVQRIPEWLRTDDDGLARPRD